MRGRSAEERHHRVADELLDGAAEALELLAQMRVVRGEQAADVLGIELLGAGGEADEIGEEHRHDLALLAHRRRRSLERRAAGVAEPGGVRILGGAAWADDHSLSVRLPPSTVTRRLWLTVLRGRRGVSTAIPRLGRCRAASPT